MSLWIDKKYIGMVSYKLEKFKQRGDTYNFRCPLCGDSKKDKSKTRGYLYKKSNMMFFHCHNCNESMSFGKLLKRLDGILYRQYNLETFAEKDEVKKQENVMEFDPVVFPSRPLNTKINLPSIQELDFSHFAKKYILSRKIPENFLNDIYYTTCFKTFIDEIIPGNNKDIPLAEKRIIIPFYDKEKRLLGIQGRALFESKLKYMTLMTSEGNTKLYGMDRVNDELHIKALEGPFDSMFLDNAMATMDSAIYRIAETYGHDKKYLFIYDNEKRNSQINHNMEKTIDLGHDIFIWPKQIQCKDINDLVLSGKSKFEIENIIKNNTYSGLKAKVKMSQWKN